jgi:hypothetical protein
MRGIVVFIRSLIVISFFILYIVIALESSSAFNSMLIHGSAESEAVHHGLLDTFNETFVDVLIAAVSGMLGSVVSLLLRIG